MFTASKEIVEKLIKDMDFRLTAAKALGVSERTIWNYANSNSDNLTKWAVVQVYLKYGFKLQNMFEEIKKTASTT